MRRAYSMEGEMRGKDINLTVTAGVEHVREIKAVKENGEIWPIENIAVKGLLWDMRMDEVVGEIECRVTEDGKIEVKYPAMGIGRYIFVIDGESEDGQLERIIEGYIGYEEPRMVEEGEEGEEMIVYIGKEKRKVLFGRNSGWTGLYNKTIEEANKAVEASNSALEALRESQEFIKSWNEAVSKAIRVDEDGVLVIGNYYTGVKIEGEDGKTPHIGENDNWWIGERDLGMPSRGENGLTPSISHDGYWVLGDWKSPVQARGRDGIDGTAVRRILIDNVSELPSEGETCNGGVYYYVPNAEGEYDVYAWLESKSGKGWVRVTMAYDIATSEVYGLNKLGTDIVHEKGAVVGVNGDGRMTVPPASAAEYGAFMASSTKVEKRGGAPIYLGDDGKYYVNIATTNTPGGVIYSAWGATPDNYCIGPNTSGWIDVMDADVEQKGVVYKARDMSDTRQDAVLNSTQVRNYLQNNYYGVDDVYTKAEVERFVSNRLTYYYQKSETLTSSEVHGYVGGQLAAYYKKNEVEEKAESIAQELVNEALTPYETQADAESKYIQTGIGGSKTVHVMSKRDFDALSVRDSKAIYLVKRNA